MLVQVPIDEAYLFVRPGMVRYTVPGRLFHDIPFFLVLQGYLEETLRKVEYLWGIWR